ncbi:uncharacterized protein LOC116121774 [Pistacia vera]|uniref:uncharacterized protein LOC116121774 n=1 Tax=Pistacia vera TaxID=55513 RepID=UPI00126353F0|nr:uncharacterized protein LOC116121774 [Pistacia vera]
MELYRKRQTECVPNNFAGSWQAMRGNFSKAGWQEETSTIKPVGKAWYQTMISNRFPANRIRKLLKGWLAGGGICNQGCWEGMVPNNDLRQVLDKHNSNTSQRLVGRSQEGNENVWKGNSTKNDTWNWVLLCNCLGGGNFITIRIRVKCLRNYCVSTLLWMILSLNFQLH